MALAIDASTPAIVSTATGTGVTTASFTAPSNSVLVALIGANGSTAGADMTFTTPTNTGTALTWTRRARKNTNAGSDGGAGTSGGAEIWTAFNAASQAVTVTADNGAGGAGRDKSLQVMVLTGADQTQLTHIITASSTSGLPSATLTGCAAGSYVFAVSSDWSALGAGTAGTSQTIISEYHNAGQCSIHGWRTTGTLSGAGSQTMNLTAPSAENYNICVIEVLAVAAAGPGDEGPQTVPMRLPALSYAYDSAASAVSTLFPMRPWQRRFQWVTQPWLNTDDIISALTGDAAFTGTATLSADGVAATSSGVAFTGTANLAATGSVATSTGAAFTGTATLAATGTVTSGLSSGAAFTGTATIAATGTAATATGAAFTGTAMLAATGTGATSTGAALTGTATLTAAGVAATFTGAAFTGTATLTASGTAVSGLASGAALTGTATLAATGSVATATGAAFTGTATLATTGTVGKNTGAAFTGTGTLAATGTVGKRADAAFTGAGTLVAAGATNIAAAAAFTATATLTATGTLNYLQPVPPITVTGSTLATAGASGGSSAAATVTGGTSPTTTVN